MHHHSLVNIHFMTLMQKVWMKLEEKQKTIQLSQSIECQSTFQVFLSSDVFNTPDNIFEITGAKENNTNSSTSDFYKIYSNSDFLKNFDIVLQDHKDFTDPSKITIKCKAIKKLIPYNGFYPCQRTISLAEQFYSSYKDFVRSEATATTYDGNTFNVGSATWLSKYYDTFICAGCSF